MTPSFLRPALLVVLIAALTACGGKATFDVAGTVTGLQYEGLVLANLKNSDTVTVAKGATTTATFRMPSTIEYGTEYQVAIKTQPAHQTCVIPEFAAKDTAGRLASIDIPVSCEVNQYAIGGTVTGLTADGLVLVNGSTDRVAIAKDAPSYAFPGLVQFGSIYTVGVLTNPTGLKCTVVRGVGTMGTAGDKAVTDINVSCVPG